MEKQIICLDFDGVINNYKGWNNEGYNIVVGKPVLGARQAIKILRKKYIVLVNSVRCGHEGGKEAIIKWLNKYRIEVDGVTIHKPVADYYVDDRGITFRGDWAKAIRDIRHFRHWKFGKGRGFVGDVE